MKVNKHKTTIKSVDPISYLYLVRLDAVRQNQKREPSDHEKINIYAQSGFDYRHASIPVKIKLEQEAKEFNEFVKTAQKKEGKK